MPTLADVLIPKLREKFPDRGLVVGTNPCACFPAAHANFGDIVIYDEGEEFTLVAGRFTHGHFSSWDDERPYDMRVESIVDAVIDFLQIVFADGYVFWGSHDRGGGWRLRDAPESNHVVAPSFVWSGPLPA